MKKFIQICSLLSLVVLFTAVSASAQSGFGTEVNIPFAFNVGDQSYEAGSYIVRVEKLATGAASLTIQNTETEETHRVLMNVNGDSAVGDTKLVFDTIGGQRFLTKVRTSDKSYAVIKSRAEKDAAARARLNGKPVSEMGGGAN